MENIYTDGDYLEHTETWHSEDSPWKADQVSKMLRKHSLKPDQIAEIGCGAGVILSELSRKDEFRESKFSGYDISPQAIEMCQSVQSDRIQFHCEDLYSPDNSDHFDLLLMIDVFEHVPDYMGFIAKCNDKATYKIYHVPLDLHVSSVLRNSFLGNRYSIGHLHYFSEQSAIVTIKDSGQEVVDSFLTDGALALYKQHPSFKRMIANIPRRIVGFFSESLAARLFGGYSLLVLAK